MIPLLEQGKDCRSKKIKLRSFLQKLNVKSQSYTPCFDPQGPKGKYMRIEPCDTCHGLQIGCYTSDLCVSSHDMYDMRAQCTMFWIPPLEIDFQIKLHQIRFGSHAAFA